MESPEIISPPNRSENFQPCHRIGVSVDIGQINHPIYGQSTKLSGVIPLLLPKDSYINPSIVQDPSQVTRLIQDFTKDCRLLWEDDLDEVIAMKIKDYTIIGTYINPLDNAESPKMKNLILGLISTFAVDDVLDQLGSDISEYGSYESITNSYMKLFDGEYAKFEDIPMIFPSMENAIRLMWKFCKDMETLIPDLRQRWKPVRQEIVNYIAANILQLSMDQRNEKFSEEMLCNFGGYCSALPLMLEYILLFRDIEISEQMRDGIIFRNLMTSIGKASTLMNAILGLKRDIELDQMKDSPILRQVCWGGQSLQSAFEKVFEILCSSMKDIQLALEWLPKFYPEEKNMKEFRQSVELMMDGQLYAYMRVARYGSLDMKVVEL